MVIVILYFHIMILEIIIYTTNIYFFLKISIVLQKKSKLFILYPLSYGFSSIFLDLSYFVNFSLVILYRFAAT